MCPSYGQWNNVNWRFLHWLRGVKRDPVLQHNCASLLQSNVGKKPVMLVSVEMFYPGYLDLHMLKMYNFKPIFISFSISSPWKYAHLICKTGFRRTEWPNPPNSSCCRVSDAIICIYRLIALSTAPFKHVHYKCQSCLRAACLVFTRQRLPCIWNGQTHNQQAALMLATSNRIP